MCKIEKVLGYLSTLSLKTTLNQLIQPSIKNNPPKGVMGPTKLDQVPFKMVAKTNKYKDPLKKMIPEIKKIKAHSIPFCSPNFA